MKVLFVHDGPIFIDPKGDYYANFIDNSVISKYLMLGDFVTLLSRVKKITKEQRKQFSKIESDLVNILSFPDFKTIVKFFTKQPKAIEIIDKAVRDHDIVIARLPCSSASHAVRLANKYKKPILSEVVACTWDVLINYSTLGKLMAPFYYLKQKRIIKTLKHSIYVTNNFLQKRYPTHGQSIGCSDVKIDKLDSEILVKRLRKINDLVESEEATLSLGTVGTLGVPYKGQIDVIEALSRLKCEGILRFKYKLVGQGDPSLIIEAVRKFDLENDVEIIGPISREKIDEFNDELDLYIHPSRTEGLPRAPIEAMSRACPVLGSTAGGIPELLNENTIFKKGKVDAIVEILLSVDKSFLIREAKTAFNRAKNYDSNFLALKRFNFYKKFLVDNGLSVSTLLEDEIKMLTQLIK